MNFKVLDLFSGAGGFSYGLGSNDEFEIKLANDYDKNALLTFKKNHPDAKIIFGNIADSKIKNKLFSEAKKLGINMIIGGPPCQGYSLQGLKKGLDDKRNFLFKEFVDVVKNIEPEIFIMENVKAITSTNSGFFLEEIKENFEKLNYILDWKILNSENFGVPQKRERFILVGSKTKKIILKNENLLNKVNVKDAISDLNYLNSSEGKFESNYLIDVKSEYQKEIRRDSKKLHNHQSTNHSKESIFKMGLIPPEKGKEYLPKEYWGKQKFSSTWSRLIWNKSSPTIDTRFDTPSNGRNIHPELNRAITGREAARIQSFPDVFIFLGTKTSIQRQIGNAVPPLLARGIGKMIINSYKEKPKIENKNYKIYNDDSFKKIDEWINNNEKVDHIITDPPYNISIENNFSTLAGNRKGLNFGEWDKKFELINWIEKYSKLINDNGTFIIFCSYIYVSFLIKELIDCGFLIKDLIKWTKSNPMPKNINRRYVTDTEFAIWSVKKNSKWVFNKPIDTPYLRANFTTPTVLGKERTKHPTQKSLKLMMEIVKIHTNKDDIILDPFMGSGTTGVAALNLNRKFIGIELDNEYYKIAGRRISDSIILNESNIDENKKIILNKKLNI